MTPLCGLNVKTAKTKAAPRGLYPTQKTNAPPRSDSPPLQTALVNEHPHQDAIHVAGWVSLFTLHVLWPFLWIWATLWRKDRGWGFQQIEQEQHDQQHRLELMSAKIDALQAEVALLKKAQSKPAGLNNLAEKGAGGGARNRPVRRAASYLFPELLLLASLYRVGGASAGQNPLARIDFIDQTARALSSRLSAEQLACQYQDFIRAYQINERLYLDFAPIMVKFFFDLHS